MRADLLGHPIILTLGVLIPIVLAVVYVVFFSRKLARITSPIIDMELVRSREEVEQAVGDLHELDRRENMRLLFEGDFLFIMAYWLLFLILSAHSASTHPACRIIAALLITLAACFDVFENTSVLRILSVRLQDTTQKMIDAVEISAKIKWWTMFLSLIVLGFPPAGNLMAVFWPGALVGILGLAFFKDKPSFSRWIKIAFNLTIIATAFLLLREAVSTAHYFIPR